MLPLLRRDCNTPLSSRFPTMAPYTRSQHRAFATTLSLRPIISPPPSPDPESDSDSDGFEALEHLNAEPEEPESHVKPCARPKLTPAIPVTQTRVGNAIMVTPSRSEVDVLRSRLKRCHNHVSPLQKGRILLWREQGHSIRDIAGREKIPRTTVCRITNEYFNDVDGHLQEFADRPPTPRPGRPLKYSDRIRRWIIRSIEYDRFSYISEIQSECPVKISRNTIRRYISKSGLDSRIARKKPFLNLSQRKARLAWCTQYTKGWGMGEWDRVIWTDECSFKVGKNSGRLRCWRRPNEAFTPKCLRPTFKSGRSSLMVWGCITKGRKGPLVFLEREEK